jgi:hypothetical protein
MGQWCVEVSARMVGALCVFASTQDLNTDKHPKVWACPMSVPPLEIKIPVVDPSTEVDLVPHILATGLGIGNFCNKYVFKCLLDSDGTIPMINKKCILSIVHLKSCDTVKFASVYKVKLRDFCLPKFSMTHQFQTIQAFVFDAPDCPYDILLFGHEASQDKTWLL